MLFAIATKKVSITSTDIQRYEKKAKRTPKNTSASQSEKTAITQAPKPGKCALSCLLFHTDTHPNGRRYSISTFPTFSLTSGFSCSNRPPEEEEKEEELGFIRCESWAAFNWSSPTFLVKGEEDADWDVEEEEEGSVEIPCCCSLCWSRNALVTSPEKI